MHKKITAWITACILLMVSMTVWAKEEEKPYGGLDPDAVVLKVGKDEIPLRKAYFLVKLQQAVVQDMQKSVYGSLWYKLPLYEGDRSFEDNMKESIMNLLIRMSLAKQHQKEYQVSISKSEKEKIHEAVQLFLDSNSQEAQDAMMADEAVVTEILTDYTILCKVIDKVTKDVKVEYGEAKTYSYIYGSFGADAGKALDDVSESTETLIEEFNDIQKEAAAGRSFDNVASDKGYPVASHTYFIENDSDQLAEFNQVMNGLAIGETSQVTYVGDHMGLFIGCMQELDLDSLNEAKEDLKRNEQQKVLRKTMLRWQEELSVEIQDIWNGVTMEQAITVYRNDQAEDAQTN